jgi:hypothetical protein
LLGAYFYLDNDFMGTSSLTGKTYTLYVLCFNVKETRRESQGEREKIEGIKQRNLRRFIKPVSNPYKPESHVLNSAKKSLLCF